MLLVRNVREVHKHVFYVARTLGVAHSTESRESLPVTMFETGLISFSITTKKQLIKIRFKEYLNHAHTCNILAA